MGFVFASRAKLLTYFGVKVKVERNRLKKRAKVNDYVLGQIFNIFTQHVQFLLNEYLAVQN